MPSTPYSASPNRYQTMPYRAAGRSGLKLPGISLGLWHNFGGVDVFENARELACAAFDLGITHFDLANNYGPPPGSAEETFGRILARDLGPHRDEIILSTKAGYGMWTGPYGDLGSRKSLLASLDQSLRRMGVDYVDIFYHHRPDPETPLEETMGALDHAVRSGKALYVGLSNYPPELTRRAAGILKGLGTPCLIHQPAYNMFRRDPEKGLFAELEEQGIGCIAFSPLAQGQLTDRYLDGLPPDSRAVKSGVFLSPRDITEAKLAKIRALNALAKARGQGLAQMALAWVMRPKCMTSVLIGASRKSQIAENVAALANLQFEAAELEAIERILAG
jgi:L-glyceraldehyde 3-phosphate reductase